MNKFSEAQKRAIYNAYYSQDKQVFCGAYGQANRKSCLALTKTTPAIMKHVSINTFKLTTHGEMLYIISEGKL